MKGQIWSLGGSGIPMTFVDLCYQPLTWTNVVSMETGLRIGLQRGWVVDGVADTSWITALDQSMEFRHLGPWIRTQRQGGEMIWNSIGLYFLGGLVQGEDNYSTCGNGLEVYWIMTNQLVNIRWFSSWCGYLGNVLLAFTRMLWTALSWGGMWCSICVAMPKAHFIGVVIAQVQAQDIHYKRRKVYYSSTYNGQATYYMGMESSSWRVWCNGRATSSTISDRSSRMWKVEGSTLPVCTKTFAQTTHQGAKSLCDRQDASGHITDRCIWNVPEQACKQYGPSCGQELGVLLDLWLE